MIVTPGNPRKNWRESNPRHQAPNRFRENTRVHVTQPGQSPGTMEFDEQTGQQAPGIIRRLWLQALSGIPGPPPVDVSSAPAVFTRGTRYRTQSFYMPAGSGNTRFTMLHTVIRMASRQPHATLSAGTRRGRPVIRNRISSFGSRVQPLNRRATAAQEAKS